MQTFEPFEFTRYGKVDQRVVAVERLSHWPPAIGAAASWLWRCSWARRPRCAGRRLACGGGQPRALELRRGERDPRRPRGWTPLLLVHLPSVPRALRHGHGVFRQ